jgi:hypothetical protein
VLESGRALNSRMSRRRKTASYSPAMAKQAEDIVALRERVLRQLEQDDEANTVETTATTVELNGGFLNGGNNGKP